jgi:hypothetical protein
VWLCSRKSFHLFFFGLLSEKGSLCPGWGLLDQDLVSIREFEGIKNGVRVMHFVHLFG